MTDLLISALLYLDQSTNPKVQEIVKEIQHLEDTPSKLTFPVQNRLQNWQDYTVEEREFMARQKIK